MTLINDDINLFNTISDNQVKALTAYFYGYLKGQNYHADWYRDKDTGVLKNIEFYENQNDKAIQNEKARYSFIVNKTWILFYFKKRSELSDLEIKQLNKDFGDDFKLEPNRADESTVKIKVFDKAKLLTDKYLKT